MVKVYRHQDFFQISTEKLKNLKHEIQKPCWHEDKRLGVSQCWIIVFLCKGGHPSSQTPQDAPNLSHLSTCWNQDMFHNSNVLWWKGSNPGLFLHWFILKRIKYESCHSEVVKKSQFEGQIGNKPKSFSFLNFMQTSGSLVVLGRPLLGF